MHNSGDTASPRVSRHDLGATRIEAFVDAVFAFAMTLLVISGDHIPRSVEDLIDALKNVPTYAASFLLLLVFWNGHREWSERYRLDDAKARRLSLLLVFLVLIFVYPLRMVFASLFALLSHGWLPANFAITRNSDVPALFITYGAAYGALCAVMWALYRHAWRSRETLGLAPEERITARALQLHWTVLTVVAGLSVLVAACLLHTQIADWRLGLPGYLYFGTRLTHPLQKYYRRRACNGNPPT